MKTLPKISVIIPSFNKGSFIEEAIISFLNQDYPHKELIIIDGGSTDETVSIIKKYQDKIDYWVSEKDRGQSHALNKGLKVATGELVGWLNADEYYTKNAFNMVAEAFKTEESYSVFYGNVEKVEEGSISKVYNLGHIKLNDIRYSRKIPIQPSVFFKLEALVNLGFVKEDFRYAMDVELYCRLIQCFEFYYLPYTLGGYNYEMDNISAKYRNKQIKEVYKIHLEVFENGVYDLIVIHSKTLIKYLRYYLKPLRIIKKIIFKNA